jgi:hypothetical protein
MVALGVANIAIAATGDMVLWAWFVSLGAMGAKIVAFGVQYLILRSIIYRKIRAALRAVQASP